MKTKISSSHGLAAVTLGVILTAATPAFACHRYHKWLYPWPQRCAVGGMANTRDYRELSRVWYVEITGLPDDVAREQALDALKEIMK